MNQLLTCLLLTAVAVATSSCSNANKADAGTKREYYEHLIRMHEHERANMEFHGNHAMVEYHYDEIARLKAQKEKGSGSGLENEILDLLADIITGE